MSFKEPHHMLQTLLAWVNIYTDYVYMKTTFLSNANLNDWERYRDLLTRCQWHSRTCRT
jgi:hypothetical protein